MLRRISLIALLITIAMPGYTQTETGAEWRKQIVIRLSASKRFPLEAKGQAGTAQVGFVLDRQGRLVSHWLEESTGSQPLDLESLAIVERAQPFPIPPLELDETHLRMSAPILFRSSACASSPRQPRHQQDQGNPPRRNSSGHQNAQHLPRLLSFTSSATHAVTPSATPASRRRASAPSPPPRAGRAARPESAPPRSRRSAGPAACRSRPTTAAGGAASRTR